MRRCGRVGRCWRGRTSPHRLRSARRRSRPFLRTAARLAPTEADLSQLGGVNRLNSGFSKIHALLIDDYPMYDSRVACALSSMVRRYCEESGSTTVPRQLALSIPPSQGRLVRNPSHDTLRFRQMRWRDTKQYGSSNVIAAWLLGALAADGDFGNLEARARPRSAVRHVHAWLPPRCGRCLVSPRLRNRIRR